MDDFDFWISKEETIPTIDPLWTTFAGPPNLPFFTKYNDMRVSLLNDPERIIEAEKNAFKLVMNALIETKQQIKHDFDSASSPASVQTWWSARPYKRGRAPVGDNIPWSEVAEHTILSHVVGTIAKKYRLEFPGCPFGGDRRFLIPELGIFLSIDGKSCGPRDSEDCIVLSPNQVSGNGILDHPSSALINHPVTAYGRRSSHLFCPALPPLCPYNNNDCAIHVTLALAAIYAQHNGQHLKQIIAVVIPNGLLGKIEIKGLIYPGKDDQTTPINARRARLSLPKLVAIDPWRVEIISFDHQKNDDDIFHF